MEDSWHPDLPTRTGLGNVLRVKSLQKWRGQAWAEEKLHRSEAGIPSPIPQARPRDAPLALLWRVWRDWVDENYPEFYQGNQNYSWHNEKSRSNLETKADRSMISFTVWLWKSLALTWPKSVVVQCPDLSQHLSWPGALMSVKSSALSIPPSGHDWHIIYNDVFCQVSFEWGRMRLYCLSMY